MNNRILASQLHRNLITGRVQSRNIPQTQILLSLIIGILKVLQKLIIALVIRQLSYVNSRIQLGNPRTHPISTSLLTNIVDAFRYFSAAYFQFNCNFLFLLI